MYDLATTGLSNNAAEKALSPDTDDERKKARRDGPGSEESSSNKNPDVAKNINEVRNASDASCGGLD